MKHRLLGAVGPRVSSLGLGCMGMSDVYGPADRAQSIATIHAALEAGVSLLDTGDFYGMGHNELLIREALEGRQRDKVVLSVKFGSLRDPSGSWLGLDGRPAAVKTFLAYSLKRLGTDYVDVYRMSRVDPRVPIEETIGAISDLVKAGWVRHVGLSEAGVENIRRANAVHPICDVQLEYAIVTRGIEDEILPVLRELGISVTAYGVLARGILGGHMKLEEPLAENDHRAYHPRFTRDNLARNLERVEALRAIADRKGTTVAAIAIAWALSRGPEIVPLVGARTPARLEEALRALEVELEAADLEAIDQAAPPSSFSGGRYPAPAMLVLDSERRPPPPSTPR